MKRQKVFTCANCGHEEEFDETIWEDGVRSTSAVCGWREVYMRLTYVSSGGQNVGYEKMAVLRFCCDDCLKEWEKKALQW